MLPALRRCGLVIAVVFSILAAEPQQAWASPATTTTTLAVASAGNAVTTVTSGSVVTLTATVTAGGNPVSPGQINFCDATAKYCTDIHVLGSAQLTATGTATLKFRPGVGSHSYKAVFLGTADAAASASAGAPVTVSALSPTPSITSIAATGPQGTYSLTATVSGGAGVAPSGSVSFVDTTIANAALGTATLTPAASGVVFIGSGFRFEAPSLVATGDFNGDGIADLIGVDGFGGAELLLGNGDGTFTDQQSIGTNVNGIVAGDFNGDGKLDLALTLSVGGVVIELGNGDGTVTSGYQSPQTIAASGIAVGDFNGDGKLDLVVGGGAANSNVTVLLGKGDGTFTVAATTPTGANPTSVAVGDLNGDGKLDLAVGNQSGNSVSILLGNGDGTFAAGSTITTTAGPNALAIADFNGDGKLDLAVLDNGAVTILLGHGDGTFTAAGPTGGYSGTTVVVGDFNADSIADLGVAGDLDSVLLGNGDGTFTTVVSLSDDQFTDSGSIAVADFNGDGASDIAGVLMGDDADEISISLSQAFFATATLNNVMIFPVGGNPGNHGIDAGYAGDTRYAGSVASPIFLHPQPLISASLTSVPPIVAGASATSTLTITPYPGFTGPVSLTCVITASGTAPTCSSPGSVTISGTAAVSVPIGIYTTTQTTLGSDQLKVSPFDGIDQNVSITIPFTVVGAAPPPAPGFTLAGTAIGISSPGATGTSTVTITPTGGFTGTVALTCAVTGSPAGAADIPACSVTAPAAISGTAAVTATLTVHTQPATTPGTYPVTVTATSGSITNTANVMVTILPPPNFTLSSAAVNIASPGASGTSTLTITPSNGFTGTVALTCSVTGSPAGAADMPTCSVTAPAAISGTAPVTATLTVSTTPVSSAVVHDPLRRSFPLGGGVAMAALLLFGIPRRSKMLLSLLLFASLAAAAIGCAGTPTPATPPVTTPVVTPTNPGTTPGAYTITVTGTSGAVTQSTAVTVAVS
jgi:trimeric autotransporter adhesin